MDYIIIMLFLIIILVIIAIVYEVNLNKLKQFAISEEGKFNKIADKYPSNIEICEIMLKKLKNDKVKVEEDKNAKTSLYIAITDKILIADVKNSYTRIQTIAHECLHSVQSRKILLFNFIYSNIYLLYFFIVTILALFNKLQNGMLYLSIMLILSYTYYFIRSYLENDAMIKAKFLAKEYMEEINISSKEEVNSIVDSFNKLNNTGIKITNFQLMFETIIKVIILSIAFLI
jgi:hypothetical protein